MSKAFYLMAGVVGAVLAVSVAMVQPQPTASAPAPDVNGLCGPALSRQLAEDVRSKALTPVHANWSIHGNAMTIEGIFATGSYSRYLIARCSVVDGAASLQPLEDKEPS